MKKYLSLIGCALFFTGCCSYVQLDTDMPEGACVEGGKPIASFYVQNTSYQIFGVIPWCSGVNWTRDDMPLDEANDWRIDWFDDEATLDNNIRTLKRACKEVGSNRVAAISHNIFEDSLWSFFFVNRKTIKTNCFIMAK